MSAYKRYHKHTILALLVLIISGCTSEIISETIEKNLKMILLNEEFPTDKGNLIIVDSKKVDNPSLQNSYAVELHCNGENCFIQKGISKTLPKINEALCLLLAHNQTVTPITFYRKRNQSKEEGFILLDDKLTAPTCPNYGILAWHRDEILEKGGIEFSLGFMYQQGYGVTRDNTKAIEWYRKAAELGNVKALNNLGNIYSSGNDIEKNNTEALKWYRKAAAKNDSFGKYHLEQLQKNETDSIHGFLWYRRETTSDVRNRQLFLPPGHLV